MFDKILNRKSLNCGCEILGLDRFGRDGSVIGLRNVFSVFSCHRYNVF